MRENTGSEMRNGHENENGRDEELLIGHGKLTAAVEKVSTPGATELGCTALGVGGFNSSGNKTNVNRKVLQ